MYKNTVKLQSTKVLKYVSTLVLINKYILDMAVRRMPTECHVQRVLKYQSTKVPKAVQRTEAALTGGTLVP